MNEKVRNTVENASYPELLSNLLNNRVKLMQEVLLLIKPKKIMSMAPDHMKNMQLSFVKTLLLEELLGISNKRLRNILAGENNDSESSSSSEINENQDCDTTYLESPIHKGNKHKQSNRPTDKKEHCGKHSKKRKISENKHEVGIEEEPVVNVLNLLELQARARAIRSQLANEGLSPKLEKNTSITDLTSKSKSDGEHSSSNSVICISPEHNTIVSVKSGSDSENSPKSLHENNGENSGEVDKEKLLSTDTDSWKSRWLQSEKIQSVMKSIKFSNNFRHSRIKKDCIINRK